MFYKKLGCLFSLLVITSSIFGFKLPTVTMGIIPRFNHIFSLLKPYEISGYTKLRLGKNHDGGYVIPKELLDNIERCYTYGAGLDISFEKALSEIKSNIITRIYDHTIGYPEKINDIVFFKKEGLGTQKTEQLNTLINHLSENNDQNKKLLLKLDIEGAEWEILDKLNDALFENVVVLVIELHEFSQTKNMPLFIRVLEKIGKKLSIFHIHGNNCGVLLSVNNKLFPNVIEVTYINNKYITSKQVLKTPLIDEPITINCPPIDGFSLDFWL